MNDFGAHRGHVFNLGHGITPEVDPENVAVLVDAVHGFAVE
jgi:uroporphyrinogen decarboxylase